MIIIYSKETGEINQAFWGDRLPDGTELGGDEGYLVVENDVDKHKLHLCKLKLDEDKKPEEIEEPEIEYEGDFPLETRKIKSWKKHKIKIKAV